MKTPGPDHPITFSQASSRMRAKVNQKVIADTGDGLVLKEADLAPVVYFPRDDVETGFLSRTDKTTTCPYKGQASYYSMMVDGELRENCVWSYEDPYSAVEQIRGRLAFDPAQVDVYAYDPDESGMRPDHLYEGLSRP